jgi:hypothetical protein
MCKRLILPIYRDDNYNSSYEWAYLSCISYFLSRLFNNKYRSFENDFKQFSTVFVN